MHTHAGGVGGQAFSFSEIAGHEGVGTIGKVPLARRRSTNEGLEQISGPSLRRGLKRSVFLMTPVFSGPRKEDGARFGDRAAAPKRCEVAEEKGPGVGLAFGCHGDRTRSLVTGSGPSEGLAQPTWLRQGLATALELCQHVKQQPGVPGLQLGFGRLAACGRRVHSRNPAGEL